MKKICHVTSAHYSNDARIFRLECVSLARSYETYIVVRGESRVENGVNIIGVGDAPSSRLLRMLIFTKKVYKEALKLDCDLYHIHDPELLPYALKLKKKGKIVIFDSHENTLEQMDEKKWIPSFLRGIVSKMYRFYATKIFKQLSALISVTPHIVDQLKNINQNTVMVTNYPIVDSSVGYRERSDGGFSVCFTGGIDPQWNHESIIKAIENTGINYNLCGRAEESYIKHLKSLNGWKNVNYFGKVSFAESRRIQNDSDVGIALLSPSNNTGNMVGTIGNTKLFEYMMSGLPLICTDFILWKEIIEKYKCGICVKIDDPQKLRKALCNLRDNPAIAEEMGRNGIAAVRSEYNWQTQEKVLFGLYNQLLS